MVHTLNSFHSLLYIFNLFFHFEFPNIPVIVSATVSYSINVRCDLGSPEFFQIHKGKTTFKKVCYLPFSKTHSCTCTVAFSRGSMDCGDVVFLITNVMCT